MKEVIKILQKQRGVYDLAMRKGMRSNKVHIPSVIAQIDKAIALIEASSLHTNTSLQSRLSSDGPKL